MILLVLMFVDILNSIRLKTVYWLTPFVPLWWGLPPKITLAVALAVAVALALKVSESPLIGPGGQPLSLWF